MPERHVFLLLGKIGHRERKAPGRPVHGDGAVLEVRVGKCLLGTLLELCDR